MHENVDAAVERCGPGGGELTEVGGVGGEVACHEHGEAAGVAGGGDHFGTSLGVAAGDHDAGASCGEGVGGSGTDAAIRGRWRRRSSRQGSVGCTC